MIFNKMSKNVVQVCVIAVVLGSRLNLAEERDSILKDLQAECTHEGIRVKLWFQKQFHGIAYSNGHYETPKCRYIPPPLTPHPSKQEQGTRPSGTNFTFLIPINECGTIYHGMTPASHKITKRGANKSNDNEIYIENTLLIQNDPTIQEAGDVAKTLRCVWQKEIHRPLVASFPFVPPNSTHDQIKAPQRIVPVSSSFQSRYGHNPHTIISNQDPSGVMSTSTPTYNSKVRLRFQKKGQVQSVPNRRYFSRSLLDKDQEETASGLSGELISVEYYGGEEVFSDENNTKQLEADKDDDVSLSPVVLALPLRTSNQISSPSVSSGSLLSLISSQPILAVTVTLSILGQIIR